MDTFKVLSFIDRLSSDTIKGNIDWERATRYAGVDPNSPAMIAAIFSSNEFRQISYSQSFIGQLPSKNLVYLIDATTISGKSGVKVHALEFYIEDFVDHPHQLYVDLSQLYRLRNAINSYMAKKEAPLEKLIDSYLDS